MGISAGAAAAIAAVAAVGSAGVGVYGAIESGNAQAQAAKYNSEIAQQNQQLALRNATIAGQAGEVQASASEQKTRAEVGALKAQEAAGNIDVNSGSAVDVRSSAASLGELDAITIRSNAAQTAYGYETNATSDANQSKLDTAQASQDETAGEVGAGGTFLGGVSTAGSDWAKWQVASGGFTAPSTSSTNSYSSPPTGYS